MPPDTNKPYLETNEELFQALGIRHQALGIGDWEITQWYEGFNTFRGW